MRNTQTADCATPRPQPSTVILPPITRAPQETMPNSQSANPTESDENSCPPARTRETTTFRTAVIPAPSPVIPAKAGIYQRPHVRDTQPAHRRHSRTRPRHSPAIHVIPAPSPVIPAKAGIHRRPHVPDMQTADCAAPRPQPSTVILPPIARAPQETMPNSPSAECDKMRQNATKCNENSCPPARAHARETTAFILSLGTDCPQAAWTCPTAVIPAPTHVIPAKAGIYCPRSAWTYRLESPSPSRHANRPNGTP